LAEFLKQGRFSRSGLPVGSEKNAARSGRALRNHVPINDVAKIGEGRGGRQT
jgi:hypothetical protein